MGEPVQTTAVPSQIKAKVVDHSDPNCCPKCGKKVFFAEEIKSLSRKWHKLCLKCDQCNKLLEPGKCSEHEGGIYCKVCYSRLYGPSGYGYAGGAGNMLASDPKFLKKPTENDKPKGASPTREVSPAPVNSTTVNKTSHAAGDVQLDTEETVRMPSHTPERRISPSSASYTMEDIRDALPEDNHKPKYVSGPSTGSSMFFPAVPRKHDSTQAAPNQHDSTPVATKQHDYQISPNTAGAALKQVQNEYPQYNEVAEPNTASQPARGSQDQLYQPTPTRGSQGQLNQYNDYPTSGGSRHSSQT